MANAYRDQLNLCDTTDKQTIEICLAAALQKLAERIIKHSFKARIHEMIDELEGKSKNLLFSSPYGYYAQGAACKCRILLKKGYSSPELFIGVSLRYFSHFLMDPYKKEMRRLANASLRAAIKQEGKW